MPAAIFNGDDLTIELPSIGSFDTQVDFYSAWKSWALLGNNCAYPSAFDTTGGDDLGGGQTIAPYFFCRNDLGWRIKMPDANGEIVVSGNLFPRDASTTLYQQAEGYDAFFRLEVSSRSIVTETGISGLTSAESALLKLIPALL